MGLFDKLGKLKEEKKNEALKKLSRYDFEILADQLSIIQSKLQFLLEKREITEECHFTEYDRTFFDVIFQLYTNSSEQESTKYLTERGVDAKVISDFFNSMNSAFEIIKRTTWTNGIIVPLD